MIKNTPLEYINDRINQHKENIKEYKKEIEKLQNFIKANEIRMTELEIIKDILQKGEKNIMNFNQNQKQMSDIVMKKDIEKLLENLKNKIGTIAFNNIYEELEYINLIINRMSEYIYSLEQEIIRKNQIIKDKLE
ncbi:hypothetical protein [Spiroplasma endosymbiont of Cleonymus obscurus]|uniref:hypothetical protein n=1 Tax=Spiroplasma endosymbiont of Cleonymus obscurus TaxID=3066324 RepID=UPI0037DDC21D